MDASSFLTSLSNLLSAAINIGQFKHFAGRRRVRIPDRSGEVFALTIGEFVVLPLTVFSAMTDDAQS